MQPYEQLAAWQRAHAMTLVVYRVTESWPTSGRYNLTAQTRRASVSVPTNIAEGSAKRGKREFRRYLDIALGSLAEVSYLLRLARDLSLLSEAAWVEAEGARDAAARVTWLLYRSMES
ncbi:MAG TPA: four helix bundle protein [Gemmatimonadales bacterium]|nr:four helix bundle protein [Gemmatimonadales bacterium]